VQGLFQKPPNFEVWKELVRNMITYWTHCISPNKV
jgi:hypothetical protein